MPKPKPQYSAICKTALPLFAAKKKRTCGGKKVARIPRDGFELQPLSHHTRTGIQDHRTDLPRSPDRQTAGPEAHNFVRLHDGILPSIRRRIFKYVGPNS